MNPEKCWNSYKYILTHPLKDNFPFFLSLSFVNAFYGDEFSNKIYCSLIKIQAPKKSVIVG